MQAGLIVDVFDEGRQVCGDILECQSDPKAPCRVRLQIGTVSGIKLECLSGFASEYPSGIIGIRNDERNERFYRAFDGGWLSPGRTLGNARRGVPCTRLRCGSKPGVYVYAVNGVIAYVGSAQRGLHRRLRHYEISKKMKTAMRIRGEILASLARGDAVDVNLLPAPPAMFWNGLPVDPIAGIEDGLIRKINPPWNIRGSRRTARVVSGA